jgi:hypothetical protein
MTPVAPNKIWLDGFLFWDLVIVLTLLFIDWLIGENKRKAMRERIGEWWLQLEYLTYSGLVRKDVQAVQRVFARVLGCHWYSPRFILVAAIGSCILTIATATLAYFHYTPLYAQYPQKDLGHPWATDTIVLTMLSFGPNAVLAWLSFVITLILLRVMECRTSLLWLGIVIVADLSLARNTAKVTLCL